MSVPNMTTLGNTQWRLYFDGYCNLCHGSKLVAQKWAEKRGQNLVVMELQTDEAASKGYGDAMVLEADRVYRGIDAWFQLLTLGPWTVRWLRVLRLTPPTRAMAAFFYGIVAKYRYRVFGKRSCPLPSPSERK